MSRTTWKSSGVAVRLNVNCSVLMVSRASQNVCSPTALHKCTSHAICHLSLAVRLFIYLFISYVNLPTSKADSAVPKAMSRVRDVISLKHIQKCTKTLSMRRFAITGVLLAS